MEKMTHYADLFRALQKGQYELANSLTQLGRMLLLVTILVLITGALMLYQIIGHPDLVPFVVVLVATTALAAVWIWLSLPEDISELFEGIDAQELPKNLEQK